MTTKKVPISFNEQDQANIKELIGLMGIVGVYGDFPQAIKFGINLALSTIKNPEKVYTMLKPNEMDLYFKSVHTAEMEKRYIKESELAKNKANSITQEPRKV